MPASPDNKPLRFPDGLVDTGLLVGWSMERQAPKRPIGFSYGDPAKSPATGYIDPVLLTGGEGHLITIAPTGAGKGVGCIVPALLRHDGPLIVIDPKGENVAITARRRRELGHQVVVIDPMGITDQASGQFNPLDLINIDSATAVDDAATLAHGLWGRSVEARDKFWQGRAAHVLVGCLLHLLSTAKKEDAHLTALREIINRAVGDPDVLKKQLQQSPHPEARRVIASIGIRAEETLGGILAFAQESVDFIRGPLLQQSTGKSSFALDDITRGAPLSVYLVLPPHMLETHGQLLRVWISTLIGAITRRRSRPPKPTLFVLDEAAQLGTLPQLRQALTLLRGYGLQTWSFWQDVSQLQLLYPYDWRTMINNCRVVQCFGALNMNAARDVAELTGFSDGAAVLDLAPNEMLLQLAGDEAVVARVPNYMQDPPFAGQFDKNPYYDKTRDIMPKHIAAVKFYDRETKQAVEPEPESTAPVPAPVHATPHAKPDDQAALAAAGETPDDEPDAAGALSATQRRRGQRRSNARRKEVDDKPDALLRRLLEKWTTESDRNRG